MQKKMVSEFTHSFSFTQVDYISGIMNEGIPGRFQTQHMTKCIKLLPCDWLIRIFVFVSS